MDPLPRYVTFIVLCSVLLLVCCDVQQAEFFPQYLKNRRTEQHNRQWMMALSDCLPLISLPHQHQSVTFLFLVRGNRLTGTSKLCIELDVDPQRLSINRFVEAVLLH